MKFSVNVFDNKYDVETSGTTRIYYKVSNGNDTYNIALSANGEWVCPDFKQGAAPLPVNDIGEAIQNHFDQAH
jgi:hypothetical protein